ncbi:DUF6141 family protein [Natrinema salaciae]|uniref:PH domain-containing protein n=1 Tax=Natrinema salaciae TaxID=1186196 RepID=A0A1H9BBL3_9EURY|nr:DUF6141 family protein [Natrinema salaciae]SEP86101.1 hypothetical protein SAMN04489841_0688 [Natrinema salaciae]
MTPEVAFREVQRFRQWWLWALLGLVGLVSVVAGGPVGVLTIAAIVVFFWSLRLVTEVRTDGLYVRFVPLHRSFRRVPWDAIDSVESVTYRPLREYGGWGIRWRPSTIAFNVSGSRGVYVTRPDDRDLLVGSHRPDELATAIRDRMSEAAG